MAANLSMQKGKVIEVPDIIENLDYPGYTEIPSRNADLPMPEKI